MKLFGVDFDLLHRALDYRVAKHNIIASNIANVDTPNYRAKDIYFQDVLENMLEKKAVLELRKTNKSHLDRIEPEPPKPVVYYPLSSFGYDKNGVDIDLEMSKLSENQLLYRATSQFMSGKFEKLRLAITSR